MMEDKLSALAPQVTVVASELPPATVRLVAQTLCACSPHDWAYLRLRALQVTPEPRFRDLVDQLLEAWHLCAPEIIPESVALALVSASVTAEQHRREQSVELVWTGPDVHAIPLRRTDQALMDVIGSAQRSLLVVSFAVYRIRAIGEAIVQAARRGVRVRLCIEWSDEEGQEERYDPIRALGRDVVECAEIYHWPVENRPTDERGKHGILHAKVAVADEATLFLSSANLTEHAWNLNMELGVLVRGGHLPGRVVAQFERLIASEELAPVAPST